MNKAFLIGRLVADPELRTTQSGVSVCTFKLAIDRKFPDQNGVKQADFIPIVVWRQLADLCGRYLTKGRQCAVCGSIQTRSYDAQDGSKRYVTEVVADDVEFLGSRTDHADNGSSAPLPQDAPPAAPRNENGFSALPGGEDDDLPF